MLDHCSISAHWRVVVQDSHTSPNTLVPCAANCLLAIVLDPGVLVVEIRKDRFRNSSRKPQHTQASES
jgi:hypothetical protein